MIINGALGLADAGRRELAEDRREEARARHQAIEAAIARLNELAAERHLPAEIFEPLHAHYRDRLKYVEHRSDGADRQLIEHHDEIEALLISAERSVINDLYRDIN